MFSRPLHLASGLLAFAFASLSLANASTPQSSSPLPRDGSPLNAPRHLFARQCDTEAIWPPGPGSALVPQAPTAELKQMLAEIDPARINATIAKLVSFGTRHTLSSQTDPARGIGAARDWLVQEMRALARGAPHVAVTAPSYVQPPTGEILFAVNITDVVATIRGAAEPGASPPRVRRARAPPATIVLAAVAGEEQGLFGSDHLAGLLKDAGADVQGMFTNDIVGASKGDAGAADPFSIRLFAQGMPTTESAATTARRESIGGENDSPARELARFVHEVATNAATNMTVRVIYRLDRYLRGGDHEPFLERGFPAARFTEPHENFAHQHQDVRVDAATGEQFGDLQEFCDAAFNARVARVNAAAVWALAHAPGTPKNVTIDTSVLTNNSTLAWAGDAAGDVAGYEVLWRPTDAPFWTTVIPVGLVDRATVLVSKDNAVFGVRAVGKNGFKSPATFPFPG
ncbi:Zn-dependent exopeptidase [Epithele typhae]|uniref:Zn-dependent exopeptidase n=1 Tax=Epithele typhae TaxID=378194 RepID=UPI002008647C|nr:Zn-dependent exopeptidase [Epithele typhae]KAH9917668.1 Zn-dependent exopeptidase [Epithele typhae]